MANAKGHRQFGSIRRRASGRFQVRYPGPDGKQHTAKKDGESITFDTRGDAQEWLNRCKQLIAHGEWNADGRATLLPKIEPRGRTLSEYARTWLDTRRVRGKPLADRTRELYRRQLDNHILPWFGDTPLAMIAREDVDAWYESLSKPRKIGKRSVGGATVQAQAYGLLRTIMGTAVEYDLIDKNPCRVRGGGSAKRVRRVRPASVEQLDKIVEAIPGKYKLMVLLGAWCALRFGELAELRRQDIDLKERVIRIERGVVRVTGEGRKVKDPKTDAGVRDVAIPSHLLPAIKAHLDEHAAPGKDGLLFPSTTDPRRQLAESSMRRVFYPARDKAGRPDLRFHDLRHTGAVMAAEAGATLATLMNRLGHSTPGAAMRYQHATSEADRLIADKLSALATAPATPPAKPRRRSRKPAA